MPNHDIFFDPDVFIDNGLQMTWYTGILADDGLNRARQPSVPYCDYYPVSYIEVKSL